MEPNAVNASEDTLQLVIDTISNVRRCGGIASDNDIWPFATGCLESTQLPMEHELLKPALSNAAVVLKRLEATKDVLNDLARSSERTFKVLKTQLRPRFLHHGIHSLPEENLGEIFRLVVNVDRDHKTSRQPPELILSHVCRHFRRIALGLPVVWSRLESKMPESRNLRYLERSKGINLNIVIVECRWSSRLMAFLKLVTSYAIHWKSLQFEREDTYKDPAPFNKKLAEFFSNLDLPNLESFMAGVYGDGRAEDFDFFNSWKMPKVSHISASNAIPSFRPFSPDMITSLDVHWWRSLPNVIDLPFLPNLVELEVKITTKSDYSLSSDRSRVRVLVLPRLRHFTLTVTNHRIFSFMMGRLRMPVLTELFVEFSDYDNASTTEEWLDAIPPQAFDSVGELKLKYDIRRIEGDLHLSSVFKKFPGLHRLSVEAPRNLIVLGAEDVKVPPLQSISIKGEFICRRVFLKEFVARLKHDERWDKFEHAKLNYDCAQTKIALSELAGSADLQCYCCECKWVDKLYATFRF